MARAKRAPEKQTLVRLERTAHILIRVHDELRAGPASFRTTRLIERNERERLRIAERLGELREQVPTQAAKVK